MASKRAIYKTVAEELGYSSEKIESALEMRVFHSAGELVTYLYDMEISETSSNEMDQLSKALEKEVVIKNEATFDANELVTSLIKCFRCHKNRRSILTLPCCHFTLCEICAYVTYNCPFSDCQHPIEEIIRTYF